MTKEDILAKLIELIKEQDPTKATLITEETSLQDDLDVDSIELTEFIINIEDSFHLSIPDEDVENLNTFGDLCDYLLRALK
ncbi:acyl carrier protein [Streptococcus didelphis]|uniref:Acyl carrier protein n=1 Tax=Streptococcus didelphis TaxID=102886 RepID=A0ABY9LFB2_9STRE|nr:acyl carrier protein [Streptococcus didelphis]WMB27616.1 acyl carrier protein [Streptococcus didelphis]WMB29506.1 acyl carrier protein [Streptococcus didelphis]